MEHKILKNILEKIHEDQLLDSLYNSVVVTSGKLEGPDHPKILYVNKAFEKMTGYCSSEVIGKTPRILQGKDTNREVLDRLKHTLERKEFFEGNTINYKKDGTPYHVEWNITPVLDTSGEVECFFCVQRDVTQSMLYKESLELRVQEELQKVKDQNEIIQRQSKLSSMGEMIDIIAHQWLNPLCTIKLSTQMTQLLLKNNKYDDEETKEYIDQSLKNIQHLEETLKEFREFFRVKTDIKEVALKDIVNNVLLLMKDELISHQIQVKQEIASDAKIKVIPNEFKHILINLFSNSKDAFVQKSIKNRHIILETSGSDTNRVLRVFDNAGGIQENVIQRIFEPHITTKESSGGTGIGLYMIKQILDKYNFNIAAENLNDGACFTIKLNKC